MANYVVSVKLFPDAYDSCLAVFHSGSGTMFVPTFRDDEELVAHMFAHEFSRPFSDYSDNAQLSTVTLLRAFVSEVFPTYNESSIEPLPAAWRAELGNPDGDEFPFNYDVSDLVSWYENGDTRADVCQGAFRAWHKAKYGRCA